jgi:proteic killer suppression protein
MLDAAQDIRTLSTLPGNRLESLRGDRKGQYSIRVNDQWRVCFKWRDGHAYEVRSWIITRRQQDGEET